MCFGMGPICRGYMHPWQGYRVPYGGHGYWLGAAMPKEQEIIILEDQAHNLENDLASIRKRLEELSR